MLSMALCTVVIAMCFNTVYIVQKFDEGPSFGHFQYKCMATYGALLICILFYDHVDCNIV